MGVRARAFQATTPVCRQSFRVCTVTFRAQPVLRYGFDVKGEFVMLCNGESATSSAPAEIAPAHVEEATNGSTPPASTTVEAVSSVSVASSDNKAELAAAQAWIAKWRAAQGLCLAVCKCAASAPGARASWHRHD